MIKFTAGFLIGILLASNGIITQTHLEDVWRWTKAKTEQIELSEG